MTTDPTFTPECETLAAFVDGERVDTAALKQALSTDSGRDYLIDLLATREVIATPTSAPAVMASPAATAPNRAWWIVSAAAVFLAVVGGFSMGSARTIRLEVAASQAAPAPTVVVINDVGWRESKGGN